MQTIGVWGLREEARESWDHFVSDEVVYLAKAGERDFKNVGFPKQYLNRDIWLEVHWICPCEGERESHFQIICEAINVDETLPSCTGEANIKSIGERGDRPVFIECPEFVELPEGVIPERISSEVRLKRVNDVCHCGWKQFSPVVVSGI